MTTRREFIHSTLAGLMAMSAPSVVAAQMGGSGPKTSAVAAPVGLQLYSLRHLFKKGDVAGTLAMVKQWGIQHVELAGTYGMAPADFNALLKKIGLQAVSTHADFGKLASDPAAAFADAKTFGVEYAGCAWIPHNEKERFGAADAEKAIKVFNAAGAKAKEAGLRFFYHLHGYEFQPAPSGGTFFDMIAKGTDPSLVAFEMDVYWAVRGGANPVALFTAYPGRFELTHLKDMQKGLPVGDPTGHAPEDSNVPLGTGQIDYTSVLREANRQKVKYHFIEDEHPQSEKQIPQSLQYLATLKL